MRRGLVMKWFFAVSEISWDHRDHDFRALIRSAVRSARANTGLQPHMVFDGAEGAFTQEMRDLGVTVIHHRISFYDRLRAAQVSQNPEVTPWYMMIASGAMLRLELCLLEREDEFVLYTDCDVVFLKDPDLGAVRPALFAVAPQMQRGSVADMNSGVMIINLPRQRADLSALIDFHCGNFKRVNGYDQELYRLVYDGRWSTLPAIYNWKPYWGINPDAAIVHFHGTKPPAVRRLLADPDYAASKNWRTLFFRDPDSYRHYLDLWERFQPGGA
jgi:lipopolysaccharide biosynthesis glycosyltransferase